MDVQIQPGPAWQPAFFEACYRHCFGGSNAEDPRPAPSSLEDGAGCTGQYVSDLRIFSKADLPVRRTLALAMLLRAFHGRADPVSYFSGHRLAVLRTSFCAADMVWVFEQILGSSLKVQDSWYDKRRGILRVLAQDDTPLARRRRQEVQYDELLDRNDPAVILVKPDADIPETLKALQPEEFDLGAIDREILMVFLAIRYPDLPPDGLSALISALPNDRELAGMEDTSVLLALRSTDPAELPHVLHRCLEKAREEPRPAVRSAVPLAEMAGLGAAKEAALEIVAALQAWKHGRLDWSAVPRGLLLAGEPGTGKTELARSLAGETAITLIFASYSGWQKTGNLSSFQSAMERSFTEARDNAPSVLFIDEIDAFHGRQHSDGSGHNDSYDAKVIAAFLEHLDGMAEREGVVVMGACNRLDRLDPAICRAGRFDTVIRTERPGLEDLAAILAQHLGPDAGRIDLPACATAALGQTGADCAAAVRRARMKAMRGQREFCTADLLTALAGDGPGYSAEDELRLAVHECGHAIVANALAAAEVEYLRIDAQGGSCGFREGTALVTAEHLHQMRCVNLAGRAAEQLVLGDFSTGAGGEAESDLALATRSAANQVVSYGLGSSGPIWFGKAGSAEAFREALNGHLPEVSELLDAAQETSLRILAANCDLLQRMAEKLISRRVLLGEDLENCLSAVIAPHTRTQ